MVLSLLQCCFGEGSFIYIHTRVCDPMCDAERIDQRVAQYYMYKVTAINHGK